MVKPAEVLARAHEEIHCLEPVRAACEDEPLTLERLSSAVFGGTSEVDVAATRGLIRSLIHARIPGAVPGGFGRSVAAAHSLLFP